MKIHLSGFPPAGTSIRLPGLNDRQQHCAHRLEHVEHAVKRCLIGESR